MEIKKKLFVFFLFSVLSLTVSGCAGKKLPEQSEMIFHTLCSVNLFEDGTEELYAGIFRRLRQIESTFNNYSPDSEITFINRNAADAPVPVSEDMYLVLKTALDFCELTEGAFDITVGPLVKLWNISGKTPRVPSKEELEQVLPLVGYKNIVLSEIEDVHDGSDCECGPPQYCVRFLKKGVQLDLGAIVKGFAADEAERILKECRVRRAVVSLGGNIYVHGKKSRREKWNIGIKDPFTKGTAALVQLEDSSVVTSGGYERFFEHDGRIYSHILNPVTGFPAETGIAGVTIISPNSMLDDALSTSIYVCGLEKVSFFRQSPVCGSFECVVITADKKIHATKALKESLLLPAGSQAEYF